MREIYALWIVGRNGGLLYSRVSSPVCLKLPSGCAVRPCGHLSSLFGLARALPPQDFVQLPPVDFNDKLRLASSWFGMCGISSQLSHVPGSTGIQALQADTFDLHSFHTLTGTTFMMFTEPNTQEAAELLRTV